MSSNRMDRAGPLERTILAFFVLAAASALVVSLAAPTLYTNLLLLHPTAAERYPAPVRLSLVGILGYGKDSFLGQPFGTVKPEMLFLY
jgi:hypothetical protein